MVISVLLGFGCGLLLVVLGAAAAFAVLSLLRGRDGAAAAFGALARRVRLRPRRPAGAGRPVTDGQWPEQLAEMFGPQAQEIAALLSDVAEQEQQAAAQGFPRLLPALIGHKVTRLERCPDEPFWGGCLLTVGGAELRMRAVHGGVAYLVSRRLQRGPVKLGGVGQSSAGGVILSFETAQGVVHVKCGSVLPAHGPLASS